MFSQKNQWWLRCVHNEIHGYPWSKNSNAELFLSSWHHKSEDQICKSNLLQQVQHLRQNCCIGILWWRMYYTLPFWLCINLFFSSKFSLIFMFFSIGWDVKILANCYTYNDETQCPSSPLATWVGDALGFFLVFFYLHANVYGKLKTTNIFMSIKFVLCVFCNHLCSDVVCTKLLSFRVY
jgi:hypothetical protein